MVTRTTPAPDLSVVIPVRDGAAHLAEQLRALSRQDFAGSWELVVADNGSTDATVAVAESWRPCLPDVRVVNASNGVGVNWARNAGARAARSGLLLFCDADDQVAPTWMSAMAQTLGRADLATGPVDLVDESGRALGVQAALAPPTELGFRPYAIGANLGVRREVFDRIGGFDERWPVHGGDDVDFCWRAQLTGAELGFSTHVRVRYRRPIRCGPAFRKHLGYGTASTLLARRYAPLGLRPRPLRRLLSMGARLFLRLPWLLRAERRTAWCRTAGSAAGTLRGVIWPRRYPIEPVGADGVVRPASSRPRRDRR